MKKNNPTPVNADDVGVDPRFQKLLTLLALLKNTRHKVKQSELEFLMVNQTHNLVAYRHCLYWEWDGSAVAVKVASGLVHLDETGPYTIWLKRVVARVIAEKLPAPSAQSPEELEAFVKILPITAADCAPAEAKEWRKWVSSHALIVALKDEHGKWFAGLWLDRDGDFGDLEKAFLEDLADGYAAALHGHKRTLLRKSASWRGWRLSGFSRSKKRMALAAAILALFLPVRVSATAPAEIIATEPYVISIPFDGTIRDVNVVPGQVVKKGDILVTMDTTVLKNRYDTAELEMETAEVAYSKTQREAFGDRAKLSELAILKAQVARKDAEKEFADGLLSRAEVKAERDGVAIFSDVNALRGKPVQTGEQIMQLADPKDNELLIRVPVESMIEIEKDVAPTFFLNVSPLSERDAVYSSIGYQATPDPDGLLTYKVHAKIKEDSSDLRVGWTGTAKVYGARTLLFMAILRRPFVTLRQKMGV